MAATDLKRQGINNQKRQKSYSVAALEFGDVAGDGATVFTLPKNSLITDCYSITGTGVTALGTVDVVADTTTIVDELRVDGNNKGTTTLYDCKVATDITVKVGAGAIAAGDFQIVLEYVEYKKTYGEYTE